MEGHDKEWSPITGKNDITYSNLAPGDYSLKILSSNENNIWNPHPHVFNFIITAPFWDMWEFQAFCLILGVWLIFLAFGYRTRKLKREKENLEKIVQERTKDLAREKEKSDNLLLNILPKQTADELKNQGYTNARSYDSASVLFTDFVGFTTLSEKLDTEDMVEKLNFCFKGFDDIMVEYGLEKIKTIGDSYMCAGGIPTTCDDHPEKVVSAALDMIKFMKEFNSTQLGEGQSQWHIRIGVHTGPLIAGVVGKMKFAYDIWGDTVNVASRMESSGASDRVNISDRTHSLVQDKFTCVHRGKIPAKNKGDIDMYFVEGRID